MRIFFFIKCIFIAFSRLVLRRLIAFALIIVSCLIGLRSSAHQMPYTVILLDVKQHTINAQLQIPLSQLELAFGHGVSVNPEQHLIQFRQPLIAYLEQHMHIESPDKRKWNIEVLPDMRVSHAEQTQSGPYQEISINLVLNPPQGVDIRNFILYYDVIIHQVVTHYALITVRQDWEAGVYSDKPVNVGVIKIDVVRNIIPPYVVNLKDGSLWNGFKGMVSLGMQHIAQGTDHLLFILALLLAAPLISESNKWGKFGGVKYSITRLLKIVTAFTIGHSLTLFAGTIGWLRLPSQPIEILIAVSIFISAIHAIRPLFPGKETYVAGGFGLIHGLAFAGTLTSLQLSGSHMALTILGFNIGIELMQLFVILITVPWLIILSRTKDYSYLRIAVAVFAAVTALAWIIERFFNQPNFITVFVAKAYHYSIWLILALAITSSISLFTQDVDRKHINISN